MNSFRSLLANYARIGAVAATIFTLATGAQADTLVLGTVGKDTKAELKEYSVLAAYLKDQLSSSGIDQVEVMVLPTAARMSDALRQGSVHLYFESPLVAAKVARDSGALPMLRRWRKGVSEYWSEILVRNDSPVKSLDDLRGRVIAFEDPDSTSGHLLPRAMLLERGLKVENVQKVGETFDPQKVGSVFTMADRTSILFLFDGRVAAIATDNQYMRRLQDEQPGSVRSIGRSITVPRHVVMRTAKMPEPQAQRIVEVLVAMSSSEEGRQVLSQLRQTDRFDAFPQGVEATFTPIDAQLRILDAENAVEAGTQ